MAHYLVDADIGDKVALYVMADSKQASAVVGWHTLVDEEIVCLASEKGFDSTCISTPLHPKLKQYARYYFCLVCFRDMMLQNLGTSQDVQSADVDKYKVKYDMYEELCGSMRQEIQPWMIWSATEQPGASNYVKSVTMWPS